MNHLPSLLELPMFVHSIALFFGVLTDFSISFACWLTFILGRNELPTGVFPKRSESSSVGKETDEACMDDFCQTAVGLV